MLLPKFSGKLTVQEYRNIAKKFGINESPDCDCDCDCGLRTGHEIRHELHFEKEVQRMSLQDCRLKAGLLT